MVRFMKTFRVMLIMRAECKSDAAELIHDYLGEETDIDEVEIYES